ncbi:hypothetical protein, partial [Nitrosopumilus sp.]|uniref:hypothetical protein n=1 Tax=Nitrosopumilus sp. TaxID=2024843 RepID=UPI00261C357A
EERKRAEEERTTREERAEEERKRAEEERTTREERAEEERKRAELKYKISQIILQKTKCLKTT